MSEFRINKEYTKKDIYELLQVPIERQRGSWETGYCFYEGEFYIFVNIGVSGTTGHDYPNRWINSEKTKLEWYGKNNAVLQHPQIMKLISGQFPIHLFTRDNNRYPFKYQGSPRVESIENLTPVKIIWGL